MCDEPYMIIGLGNAYDFVIKNVNEPETYGTFQGDEKSIKKFIEKVNRIVKENEQLKKERNYFERKKCEYFNKYNKKHLDNIQLKEENEQLKQLVNIADDLIDKLGSETMQNEWIKNF